MSPDLSKIHQLLMLLSLLRYKPFLSSPQKPGDGSGLYEAMLEAKAQGKIRHIGITNHRLSVAMEAI